MVWQCHCFCNVTLFFMLCCLSVFCCSARVNGPQQGGRGREKMEGRPGILIMSWLQGIRRCLGPSHPGGQVHGGALPKQVSVH